MKSLLKEDKSNYYCFDAYRKEKHLDNDTENQSITIITEERVIKR